MATPQPILTVVGQSTIRQATRLQLLEQYQQAGIRLWGGSPKMASLDYWSDPVVEYQVPTLDLEPIFLCRDAGQLPWGAAKASQVNWGNGILDIYGILEIVLSHYHRYSQMPDQGRYWCLRSSSRQASEYSWACFWAPKTGFGISAVHDRCRQPDIAALPEGPI